MFFTGAVSATYLTLAGIWTLANSPMEFAEKDHRIAKDTTGTFAVDQPLVLMPGIQWAGEGNFTAYHLQKVATINRHHCHPSEYFQTPCFNVKEAYYIFKPAAIISKQYICESNCICEIPLDKVYSHGRKALYASRRHGSHPSPNLALLKGRTLKFQGPAKAYAWSKQIHLEINGVLNNHKSHSITSELALPSGLSDTIYGLHLEQP
ncbi:hypothetical protein DSO57_1036541 [Entomophthora muscae]|uniref:Uncharacterized protein n=1 Tax=Entomophthora muscae TaxID=34485 RepID=A0ACC2TL56_9FUNG|nr:hypothetical protein DSO57_1036541 [Entomophthora muscae]